jgi:hypothetical protein
MEDVHFHNDRVTLHLKASKTDPFREGVDIHLFSSGASVCPVISLERYGELWITIYKDYYAPTLTKCTTITLTPEFYYAQNTVLALNHSIE